MDGEGSNPEFDGTFGTAGLGVFGAGLQPGRDNGGRHHGVTVFLAEIEQLRRGHRTEGVALTAPGIHGNAHAILLDRLR